VRAELGLSNFFSLLALGALFLVSGRALELRAEDSRRSGLPLDLPAGRLLFSSSPSANQLSVLRARAVGSASGFLYLAEYGDAKGLSRLVFVEFSVVFLDGIAFPASVFNLGW